MTSQQSLKRTKFCTVTCECLFYYFNIINTVTSLIKQIINKQSFSIFGMSKLQMEAHTVFKWLKSVQHIEMCDGNPTGPSFSNMLVCLLEYSPEVSGHIIKYTPIRRHSHSEVALFDGIAQHVKDLCRDGTWHTIHNIAYYVSMWSSHACTQRKWIKTGDNKILPSSEYKAGWRSKRKMTLPSRSIILLMRWRLILVRVRMPSHTHSLNNPSWRARLSRLRDALENPTSTHITTSPSAGSTHHHVILNPCPSQYICQLFHFNVVGVEQKAPQ